MMKVEGYLANAVECRRLAKMGRGNREALEDMAAQWEEMAKHRSNIVEQKSRQTQ